MVQERGFLVLTGMPRSVPGESCTNSIKNFAIFPPHKRIQVFNVESMRSRTEKIR